MKPSAILLQTVTLVLCIGMLIYLIVDHKARPKDDNVYKTLLDSLKADRKVLQTQQVEYQKQKEDLRTEVVQLKKERTALEDKMTQYNTQLTSIKNQYAKIASSYHNLSADSTRLLFNRYFGD